MISLWIALIMEIEARIKASHLYGTMHMQSSLNRITGNGIRLQTLILVRWLAILGQFSAILVVRYYFEFDIAFIYALLSVTPSVAFNLFLTLNYPQGKRLENTQGALHLSFDVLQLLLLLSITGGIANPFSVFLLVPVTLSSTILGLGSTLFLGALTLVCITTLALVHLPLPWTAAGPNIPSLYLTGVWLAESIGVIFIAFCSWRVAAESRQISDALAATQIALESERRLASLGGLAAAAAHRLGTPLSTINLVAKELARELPKKGPLGEDTALLVSESERCRDILRELSNQRLVEDIGSPFDILELPVIIELVIDGYRTGSPNITVVMNENSEPPKIQNRSEIVHGLGNILQNAVDFAKDNVWVNVEWNESKFEVEFVDDGPGFAHSVLADPAEPYLSTRSELGGMGLGLFIAKTLLGRTGGSVHFSNKTGLGACVRVSWARYNT